VLEEETLSAEIKASSSSLPDAVENAEVVTVVLGVFWSLETVTSTPIAARRGKLKKSAPIARLVNVARKKLYVFFIFSVLAHLELQRS
jgi:lactate dehydrogenase-like 2-hydroxyacid dehydrogenase